MVGEAKMTKIFTVNLQPEVKKTIAFIKKHLIKLQLKLEIQREATNKKLLLI